MATKQDAPQAGTPGEGGYKPPTTDPAQQQQGAGQAGQIQQQGKMPPGGAAGDNAGTGGLKERDSS
jgi:hypothetical protein